MKKYVITSIVIILVILFVPVFWLKLFQLTFGIGEEATLLIVAAIGLVGAILGGVISGGMTLMGVKRTIKHEKDIRRKDQIPQKIELIRKSVLVMEIVINETVFLPTQIFNDFNRARDTLFEYASKIDTDCYNELLKLVDIIKEIDNKGIKMEDGKFVPLGRLLTSQEGIQTVEKGYKEYLRNYKNLLEKKMLYYQKELSK
ncbi:MULTISPECIES: hypothetical protein [unclassified Lysinibacillus]|uniref:hypothetical protein n=1 Tax=unclassified Lysinibacillus TaxID=2636778 RepID=UPI003804AF4B